LGNPHAAGEDIEQLWINAWGKRVRKVQWVSVIAGKQEEKRRRSSKTVRFAFNLPGPPYILVCTQKAKEGIDLHRYCRKLLHYDLEWNPAAMEQRVGRIDRIGSLSRRRKDKPVQIYYLFTPESYEERIFGRVMERMKVFRALLGAGDWLNSFDLRADFTTENGQDPLSRFRIDFGV